MTLIARTTVLVVIGFLSIYSVDICGQSMPMTGVGISKENMKKLFQPFLYNLRGTNNEKGSGLGLSICSTLMQKQGGAIRCQSILGAGTSFILELNRSVY